MCGDEDEGERDNDKYSGHNDLSRKLKD